MSYRSIFYGCVKPWLTVKSPSTSKLTFRWPMCCTFKRWFKFKIEKKTCQGCHYNDVIMSAMASQITSLTIVYSSIYSAADQRKHQSSVSLAFVRGIHRSPVNSPHKGPVTRKMFPFDDVIISLVTYVANHHVSRIWKSLIHRHPSWKYIVMIC